MRTVATEPRTRAEQGETPGASGHGGRPRDPSRADAIREAALELLATEGYDRITMDAVAARAGAGKATLYRRWSSKAALVVDALADLHSKIELPDTGSLRGDLEAMCATVGEIDDRAFAVMRGLSPAIVHDAELRAAFDAQLVAPKRRAMADLFSRAVARGEMAPGKDVDLLTSVVPALMLHRLSTAEGPVGSAFARQIVTEVLLPAATAGAPDQHIETPKGTR